MYLDTQGMTVWPILGFPFDAPSQSIDRNQLGSLVNGVITLWARKSHSLPQRGKECPRVSRWCCPAR